MQLIPTASDLPTLTRPMLTVKISLRPELRYRYQRISRLTLHSSGQPTMQAALAGLPGFMRTEWVMSYDGGEKDWEKIRWVKKFE